MWDRVGLHTTRWRASGIGSALAILFTLAATSAMPSPALASSGSTAEPSSNPSGASSSYLQSLSCSSSSDCTAVGYQNDPTNRTCPTTPTSRQDRRWEARSDRSSNCSGGAMCCRRLHKRTATKEGETMRSMLKRPAALPAAIVPLGGAACALGALVPAAQATTLRSTSARGAGLSSSSPDMK
jgi:hypothetical protein